MDAFSVALSGMQAAQKLMSVAANNIANANSPGYQTEQAVTTDTPGGGTTATITSIPGPDNVETQLANLKPGTGSISMSTVSA